MARSIWPVLLLFAACGPAHGPRELAVRAPAPDNALSCVQETASKLGYAVDPHGPDDRLRVERQVKWTEHTPFHRWHRIEAKLQDLSQTLEFYAGTLERHATRELVGQLIAPDPELEADLKAIQSRCTRRAVA